LSVAARVATSFLLLSLCAAFAHAWPGHQFEEWKQITTWTRPDARTEQAGKPELVPLLGGKDARRIDEIRVWEAERAEYTRCIADILGSPGELKILPPKAELLGEETLDDHIRQHIRIRSEADDWITAYLLVPKSVTSRPAGRAATRLPAMICVHQTVAPGKKEPCGIQGDPELAFALQLVRRGFVCIAPDMIGFGERIPPGTRPYHDSAAFYRKHPSWSFMGKMIWDISRIVDYLRTLPFVDPLQIGSIGHSHGAYTTLFAAAYEPRISVAIASCGFNTFRSDPTPDRWSHLTALIPQLGTYLPQVKDIPFDWQHVCAMIAPRPLFVWYATQDTIFPNTDNLDAMFKDVRGVYGLYGAADDLMWQAFDGPHAFPTDGREMAYTWLAERFFPTGRLEVAPRDRVEWTERRDVIRRVIRRSIGSPPERGPGDGFTIVESTSLAAYERQLVEYTPHRQDERVRAYICIPHARDGKLPGVLVLHQTVAEGKAEAVGLAGNPSLAFAAELAERGYVTFAPDSIAAGDRVDDGKPFDTRWHYERYPDLSAMGKMVFDAQQALDLLAGLSTVDAERLGVIGHSLGAETALMLAVFDERVKATVASCGYAAFAAEKDRLRWARDQWFSYMPTLRPVFLRGDLPAWDWDHVLEAIAPRAVYQHTTREDDIFPESISAYEAGERARVVWELHDAADRFENVLKPGKHAIADETKQEMYNWLDRQLKN